MVGVSWFEAEAYGSWLQAERPMADAPDGYAVRLPNEEEWERATRGTDGRAYPWGDEFDYRHLSCTEAWAGQAEIDWWEWIKNVPEFAATTAVCTYAQGASPEGIWDAAGNVWEWTRSWYKAAKAHRVVRGGSWNYIQRDARCASRDRNIPGDYSSNLGFRVVVSLASSGC